MADSEGLGDLIQGHLVQLFETFGKIVNAAMKKVQQQDLAQNQAHQAEIAAMDELLMKEQEIMQEAEEIELDGQGLTACLQLVLWLEQQGVQEVMDVAQRVLAKSEEEVESWQSFELETGTQLRFMMTGLSFGLRKRFVQSYGEKINSIFRQYLSAYDWLNLPEPSDCKEQFFFICQLLAQANGDLNLLFEPVPRFQKLPTGKMTMKKPELMLKPKKFNQMEIEIDRFLAKKQPIFNFNINMGGSHNLNRQEILGNLVHFSLKSFYEQLRFQKFDLHGFQQVQVDLNLFFEVMANLMPSKGHSSMHGLFNEVIACCIQRSLNFEAVDDTVLETIAELKMKKLEALED